MSTNAIAIILLIASVGMFLGFINPQYQDFKGLQTEVVRRDEALKNARNLRTIRDGLLERKNKITPAQIDQLNKLLPDSVDTVRLIMDLNAIAASHNIVIRKIDFSKDDNNAATRDSGIVGPDQTPYGSLSLNFAMAATYESFMQFLDDVEQSLRIIDIDSVDVNSVREGDRYDFQVTAKTYWLK